jgi:hypothetical protein
VSIINARRSLRTCTPKALLAIQWSFWPIVFFTCFIHKIDQVCKGNLSAFKSGNRFNHKLNSPLAINAIMVEIKSTHANDIAVQHALQVRSSLATSNYHRFFLLYKETPNMGTYLIHQFIERERIYALRTMCKA